MFTHWRGPWLTLQLCFDPNNPGGAPAAGDPPPDPSAHPEYDLDEFDDPPGDDPPGAQPGAPPAVPGTPPPPPGGPGTGSGTPDAAAFTALQTQVSTLQGQLTTMAAHNRRLLQALGAPPPATPPPGTGDPQLSEADRKAVEAVYRLFPKLRGILDNADKLLEAPQAIQRFQSDDQARWDAIGTRMWDALDKSVATTYNLQGEQQVSPFVKQGIDSAFLNWLETDKNAQARYRMGDTTLAGEFMQMFVNGVIVPAQRVRATPPNGGPPTNQPPRRGAQPPRVPRGGPGTPPATPGGAPPAPKKADEVHAAAADAYFAGR